MAKEIKTDLDEGWMIEALESLFGSEALFHVRYSGDEFDKKHELECIVRRKFND